MSLELLKSIKEAEAQAESGRANAQREAREMIKGVTDACTENERHAAVEHRTLFQNMLEEKKVQVEQQLRQLASGSQKGREELLKSAHKRLNVAADSIVKRVLNDGHR